MRSVNEFGYPMPGMRRAGRTMASVPGWPFPSVRGALANDRVFPRPISETTSSAVRESRLAAFVPEVTPCAD